MKGVDNYKYFGMIKKIQKVRNKSIKVKDKWTQFYGFNI
jgi:hypothetical protein